MHSDNITDMKEHILKQPIPKAAIYFPKGIIVFYLTVKKLLNYFKKWKL